MFGAKKEKEKEKKKKVIKGVAERESERREVRMSSILAASSRARMETIGRDKKKSIGTGLLDGSTCC